MDPLSDIVALLRPTAAVSKPISGRGRWGVCYDAHPAPGFTIVLSGEAWVTFQGDAPLRLASGDFLLVPTTPAFSLSSEPGMACVPTVPSVAPVRHGDPDGPPDFVALGGSFVYERVNAPLLLGLLPGLIHIPATQGRSSRFRRLIDLLSEECAADFPGKDLILSRMLEVLLVEALRWHGSGGASVPAGLLKGMGDPGLMRALGVMHGDVRANRTVADLAAVAGMSRSAFAARFSDLLGCAPMEYLARWRMGLAKDALRRGEKSQERIAEEIGYESASAFSTAFRKRLGMAPGRFAREAGANP
jgi:AraC-like DNA-binding protein